VTHAGFSCVSVLFTTTASPANEEARRAAFWGGSDIKAVNLGSLSGAGTWVTVQFGLTF
jgi:hypothetical protein